MPDSQKRYVTLENEPNPNERELGDPEDEDTARIRIREIKNALFTIQMKAVKKYMKAKHGGYDSSAYEAPEKASEEEKGEKLQFGFKRRIPAKNMPRPPTPPPPKGAAKAASASDEPKKKEWRKKKEPETSESESAAEPASSSAKASASASPVPDAQPRQRPPIKHRSVAQELFKDAQAAQNVYAAFRQDSIDDLHARAPAGDKVGGKLFMTFLTEGVQEFKAASEYSYVPDNGRAPPSSDYSDKPEIPEFDDALGTTKELGPDESILVLNGRLDVQDMQVPAYRTGITGSAYVDGVILTERPKYLQNIDLGLKDSDQAAHSPLVVVSKLHCQRNLRTRSDRSDQRRRGRRFGRPQGRAQDDEEEEEEEEVEVEEEEEEKEPVGRLRSTTPSSSARLHRRDDQARGSFENTNKCQ
eukprot:s227_g16.t1